MQQRCIWKNLSTVIFLDNISLIKHLFIRRYAYNMSLRKLKHHEQRLLKKVDFLRWSNDDSMHVNQMVRRYHLKSQEEYVKYNKIVGNIRSLVHKLKDLDPADPFRQRMSDLLLKRLYVITHPI